MAIRILYNITFYTFSPVVTRITLGPHGIPGGAHGDPRVGAHGDPRVGPWDPWALGDPLACELGGKP